MVRNGGATVIINTTSSIVHRFIQIISFCHLSNFLYLPLQLFGSMCKLENEKLCNFFSFFLVDPKILYFK